VARLAGQVAVEAKSARAVRPELDGGGSSRRHSPHDPILIDREAVRAVLAADDHPDEIALVDFDSIRREPEVPGDDGEFVAARRLLLRRERGLR
jgi:hypothetical protein